MLAVPNLSTVLGRGSWECGHAMLRLQGRVLAGSAGKCRIMVRRFYSMLYHRRGFYPPWCGVERRVCFSWECAVLWLAVVSIQTSLFLGCGVGGDTV
jgi:hypothetical protein